MDGEGRMVDKEGNKIDCKNYLCMNQVRYTTLMYSLNPIVLDVPSHMGFPTIMLLLRD